MTPKERVRLNVYKTLLKEEKEKNKKKSYLTMSVFVVGIFAGSVYNLIPSTESKTLEKNIGEYTISRIAEAPRERDFNDSIDNYFNVNSNHDKSEIKTDEYFVLNMQS